MGKTLNTFITSSLKKSLGFALLLTTLSLFIVPSMAQDDNTIAYGETRGDFFENESQDAWQFTGQTGEFLEIAVRRIAGRFTPRLSLISPSGNLILPSENSADTHSQIISFYDGLTEDGFYTILVEETADSNSSPLILNEYSLSLSFLGKTRPIDEGLSPLASFDFEAFADIFSGIGTLEPILGVTILGEYSINQPDPVAARNSYELSGTRTVRLNNANPIARGITAIAFLEDAVALQTVNGAILYSDVDVTAFETSNSLFSISFANGMSLNTDFYRIENIAIQENLLFVDSINGQTMILQGQNFELLRRGGINGEGVNAEAVNRILIDGAEIQSDLEHWHTLAVLSEDVRVYYQDLRILSDSLISELFVNNDEIVEVQASGIELLLEEHGIGDILINEETVTIKPLDGRELSESLENLRQIQFSHHVLSLLLTNNSTHLSLPDGTIINSPSTISSNAGQNFNNLGANPYDYHPAPDFSFATLPVNRFNGNFYYQVQDFSVADSPCFLDSPLDCTELSLEWLRSYNSLSPAEQSPSYLTSLSIGNGWRHSFQYELDITASPIGQVELILPDGSRHSFRLNGSSYRSTSLLSWTIEQTENLTWNAFNTDGLSLQFDYAGRLQRISNHLGQSLLFSPIPQNYLGTFSGGFFVTDDYGRRLEIYANSQNQISEVRDVQGRSIRYSYDGNSLIGVQYPALDETAAYIYESGQLISLNDSRSPYQREISLVYDEERRVVELIENPSDAQAYRRTFSYRDGSTTETQFVSDEERRHVFSFDAAARLIRYDTARADWFYRWVYNNDTGRLSEVAMPERAVLRYQYDEYGYLTRFTDPIFGANAGSYDYRYTSPDGQLRLLSEISAPSLNGIIRMAYDELFRPISISHAVSLNPRVEEITTYTYDEMSRISHIIRPDRQVSISYDEFGYPNQISEAEGLRISQIDFDIVGRLLSLSDGRGETANFTWDSNHERITAINYAGNDYAYVYDDFGNIRTYRVNELNETFAYDAFNRPIVYTDRLGRTSNYSYDELGNLLSTADTTGREIRYRYNELNYLSSRTENGLTVDYSVSLNTEANRLIHSEAYPTGERRNFVYDVLGRLRQVTWIDRTGDESFNYSLTYSTLGYLTSIDELHVPAGRNLSLSYDLLGRPLSSTLNNAATTNYRYNQAGQVASITDPEGRSYHYEYDGLGNLTRLTQPDGTSLNYAYDENNNMISYQEAGGATWVYSYDALNRLIAVLDPENNLTSYEYDGQGNLSAIIDANNNRYSFRYDEASRLIESVDARNVRSSIIYDPRDRISRIEAAGGVISDFSYDSLDNLIAITQVGGRETLFGRDNEGRIVSITDPLGQSRFYAYNSIDTLGRFSNALGNETTYRWSASGRIIGYTSSNGAAYSYTADRIGRLQTINNTGLNQTIAINQFIEYDDSGYITAIRYGTTGTINSNQATVHRYSYTENTQIASYLAPESDTPYRFEYDTNGRIIRSIDPENIITEYRYDDLGRVTQVRHYVDSDLEASEFYEYDALGNLIRFTATDGTVSTFTYDAVGNLTQRRDIGIGGIERAWLFEYDTQGNLSLIIDPNEQSTRYRYDLFGNLIVVERNGLSTRYEYDEVDNLRRIQHPSGQSILMSYNALGQRVRYVDAENNGWSYSYDEAGKLSQINNPLGSASIFGYDVNNRLTSILYPNNAQISLSYDNRGNFSEIRLPNDERINYEFDRAGNLISIAHDNNRSSFERDNLGRITRQTNPDGQIINYVYDVAGNLISIDNQSREYDSAGRLISISDETGTTRLSYDGFGNLAQLRSVQATINYAYDALGNLLSRDAGALGRIEYEYDEFYRPVRISLDDEWISIEYNENGWRTGLLRSNGVETRYVYDENGRVRNILHLNEAGERLGGFAYEYDAVGNILRITGIDNWVVLYSYNEAQQLISERWLADDKQIQYSASYTYDSAGNRIEAITRFAEGNPERTVFVYNNQNQVIEEIRNAEFAIEERLVLPIFFALVLGIPAFWFLRRRPRFLPALLVIVPISLPFLQTQVAPSISYRYDANGNLSQMLYDTGGNLSFGYDKFNRLVSVNGTSYEGDTIDTAISYDAFGNILNINANELETGFSHDAFGVLAIQSGGDETRIFAPSGDTSIMQVSSDGVLWTLNDALGTVRSFALPEGSLLDSARPTTSAFGEPINPYDTNISLDSPQALFLGEIYEPVSGLYFIGARAYDPRLGRFLQRDPVRHDPQSNLYTYAYNRPSSAYDPTGLQTDLAFVGLETTVPSIQASDFIPSPALPPVPSLPDVHSAQAAENARLMAVAELAQSSTRSLIPYLNETNCIEDSVYSLWETDYRPSLPIPQHVPSSLTMPNVILNTMNLCGVIPNIPKPSDSLRDYQTRSEFSGLLREVPLFAPVLEEVPALQAIHSPIIPVPSLNPYQINPSIIPDFEGQFGQLQDDTFAYYSQVMMPELAPIPFRWQILSQAQNVAPFWVYQIRDK